MIRTKLRILISSDDGIYSPGNLALTSAAAQFGDVLVAASDVEQFSKGHAITSSRPLRHQRRPLNGAGAFARAQPRDRPASRSGGR
jgi:5'-nucleotidase